MAGAEDGDDNINHRIMLFSAARTSRDAETRFLLAWEERLVPFPTTAGYIRRVRQILRANGIDMSERVALARATRRIRLR
jgi:hypothetical protein